MRVLLWLAKKKWGYSSNLQKKMRVLLWLAKKMRVLLYAAEWFHPIDGSVRQLSGEYPHFFFAKKMRVLLYAAEWFHPIDGSVWQLSGEYPHFFLQVLGVPSSFFALQGGGQFFFVSANLPIPTNWTSNSRSPVSVYRSGLKNKTQYAVMDDKIHPTFI